MKKCYVFINRYLGDKQAGIQAAHAVARMMIQPKKEVLNWVTNHETLVFLNGGDHDDLAKLIEYHNYDNNLFAFREPGLNNAITAVAYVPDAEHENRIETCKALIRDGIEVNARANYDVDDALCLLIAQAHSFRG